MWINIIVPTKVIFTAIEDSFVRIGGEHTDKQTKTHTHVSFYLYLDIYFYQINKMQKYILVEAQYVDLIVAIVYI